MIETRTINANGWSFTVDVAIDGAGHFLAEELPDQVGGLLLAHLAANGTP